MKQILHLRTWLSLPSSLPTPLSLVSYLAIGDGKLVGVRNRKYGRTMLGVYAYSPTGKWNLDVRSEEFIDLS